MLNYVAKIAQRRFQPTAELRGLCDRSNYKKNYNT